MRWLDLLGERARDGIKLRDGGLGAVEGRVEAGDLRQPRPRVADRADPGHIVRLMGGRQRSQRLDRREHAGIDEDGRLKGTAAMDDPVAGADEVHAGQPAQRRHQPCCRRLPVAGGGGGARA
jgi:hypothetical protein